MKRFLLGVVLGLFVGWLTVPFLKASYSISQSDGSIPSRVNDDDDFRASHAYKWYLQQMLLYMKSMDATLKSLDVNIQAVKDKLHA
jgi:hypothetical protein